MSLRSVLSTNSPLVLQIPTTIALLVPAQGIGIVFVLLVFIPVFIEERLIEEREDYESHRQHLIGCVWLLLPNCKV